MPRLTQVPASSLDQFRLRACHALWSHFPETSAIDQIGNSTVAGPTTPDTPRCNGFGLFRFRSPLLSESRFLSPPGGTEMVHFPPFACSRLCIQRDIPGFCPGGFPHSEISGSTPVCGSPKLIAACHVLHRLFLPRHPPCALSSLTIEFTRTHQRDYRWNVKTSTFVFRPFRRSSHSILNLRGDVLLRYYKDTQHCNQHARPETTWKACCSAL